MGSLVSEKRRKNKNIRDLSIREYILCKLSTVDNPFPQSFPELTQTIKTSEPHGLCNPGAKPAVSRTMDEPPIVPISNLPEAEEPESPFPDEYQFEIYHLRREIRSLTYDVRRQNDKIGKAILALRDEIRFWKVGLYDKQWETYGQILRRLRHLEATVAKLEDFTPTIESDEEEQAKGK